MLENLLQSIRSVRDAAPLFAALGYTGDVRSLDQGAWLIARWRTFEVVGRDAPDPGNEARSLAAQLAGKSRRALAVGVGSGELALAAPRLGSGGSTRVQRISLANPAPFALRFLAGLKPNGAANALAHAIRISEMLSTETVGERFFVAFRQVLERMSASLGNRGSAVDRRTAALLPLTRVLFLYFVQAKGWLDGKPDYLRRLLDTSLGSRKYFHRHALEPLFFGTLNRRAEARTGVARLGSIPYLNGGLFEPHPVERRFGGVRFANDLWRDAFDLLFERFRFCVREADEVDAIAPDMLGRVFERVMDPADRQDTGTFYTPEVVVRQLVTAAIETVMETRAPADLHRLRFLDPAVGSGAFLLGVLDRLTELIMRAEPARQDRTSVRRGILANNLFGVDLSPIAVRLAELRLWLAVIADDPTADIPRIGPLPNLDGMVRQGDSLMDPLWIARRLAGPQAGPVALTRAVSLARRQLFDARGSGAGELARRLRQRECDLSAALIRDALHTVEQQLHELAVTARTRDLFGKRSITADQRRRYGLLRGHRRALLRARARLSEGQVPFFAFEVHAPDVIADGGFDVVIGNPPWVRAERIPADMRKTLRERFTWWKASAARGYAHLPDLAIAFLERALELAAPRGVVAFLLPAKITSASYAETARRHLVTETRLAYLHRISQRDSAGFGASIYPLAVVLQRRTPAPGDRVGLGFSGGESVLQRRLGPIGPWVLVPERDRDALEQLRTAGRPLGEIAAPGIGVKTGADDVFVGTLLERSRGVARLQMSGGELVVEAGLLRSALRGRDVRPFHVHLRKMLIWTHGSGGAVLEALPPLAAAHFAAFQSRLAARADYRAGPIWTLFRVRRWRTNRVVWSDIARRPAAAVLDACGGGQAIPLNTCYALAAPDRETALVIAAVFNSVWCAALAHGIADEARNGFRRINARVVSAFPIPLANAATRRLLTLSIALHEQPEDFPDDLDEAVADALDLPAGIRHTLRSLAHAHR